MCHTRAFVVIHLSAETGLSVEWTIIFRVDFVSIHLSAETGLSFWYCGIHLTFCTVSIHLSAETGLSCSSIGLIQYPCCFNPPFGGDGFKRAKDISDIATMRFNPPFGGDGFKVCFKTLFSKKNISFQSTFRRRRV